MQAFESGLMEYGLMKGVKMADGRLAMSAAEAKEPVSL
jgi:hypothetical protein